MISPTEEAVLAAGDFESLSTFERDILQSLRRIMRAVAIYNRKLLKGFHLTAPQLTCLRHLIRQGSRTAGQLAKALAVSQATMTGILTRLEREGLIERRRSTSDRRVVEIDLTAKGRALATSVPMPLQERFARKLADLPARRRRAIDDVLKEIVDLMEATRLDASPVLAAEVTIDEEVTIEEGVEGAAHSKPAEVGPEVP